MFYAPFTNITPDKQVECKGGKWTEVKDCGSGTCHGGNQGAAQC